MDFIILGLIGIFNNYLIELLILICKLILENIIYYGLKQIIIILENLKNIYWKILV